MQPQNRGETQHGLTVYDGTRFQRPPRGAPPCRMVYKQPWLSKIELPTAALPKEISFDESEQDQTTESAEEVDSDEATEFEMIEGDEDMEDDTEEATSFEMIEDDEDMED